MRRRVSLQDLSIFTRQIAVMFAAGMPIHQLLTFYAKEADSPALGQVVDDVANRVCTGTRLSHALRFHPQVFSNVYCGLVEMGEETSTLMEVLDRMAELLEAQLSMNKKVLATLTYPVILLLVSLTCLGGFVYFILPTILPLFTSLNVDLPWPTRVLMMSRTFIPWSVGLLTLTTVTLWLGWPRLNQHLKKHRELRINLGRFILDIPVVGRVVEQLATARLLHALATMIEAGLPIAQAFHRCQEVAGNPWIADRLRLAREALMEGDTVGQSLARWEVFPKSALQLIRAGEEASTLDVMFRYAARFYEEEAEMALLSLAAFLEPAIMLGMGFAVGFMVLSAILPTVQLLNHF